MSQADRYGVLLVSDSKHSQEAIRTILNTDSQLELTGIAENGNSALICMLREKPDLVLIDLSLPELPGLTALQLIMEHRPMPVIVLNTHTSFCCSGRCEDGRRIADSARLRMPLRAGILF